MPEEKPNQEKILSAFVIKMMADKGVEGMSSEDQDRLRMRLQEKLQEQVEQALVRMLTDEQLEELDRKLDAGASDEEIETFFAESGADAEKAMTDAMAAFREAYMNMSTGVLGEVA